MKTRYIALFISLVVAGAAAAQELTLADSVALALERNPMVAAASARADAAAEETGVARSALYPEIGASAGYRRFESRIFLPESIPFPISDTIGPMDDWSAALNFRYSLYDGGRTRATIDASEAASGSERASADSVRAQVAFAVHQAYFAALGADAAAEAAAARLRRAEEHLRVATRLQSAGAVPRLDVLRASAEVSNARLAVVSAATQRSVARGELATLLDLPPESDLRLSTSGASRALPGELAAMTATALENRGEVRAARGAVASRQALVAAARSGSRPRVELRGSYGVHDDEFVPDVPEWAVGATMNVSLFDGNATKKRVAKARAEQRAAEAELARAEAAVREDVWRAAARVTEANQSIETAEASVREAEESVRHARRRYEEGAGTITDLLDAEAALTLAEQRVIEARYALAVAEANLARAAGV
jgi:outer membrane protein